MLFRKKMAKFCGYCKHAGQAADGEMLCKKRGFVPAESKCWHFRYDPLKRTPSRYQTKDFSQFSEEDFSL
jgi:hypothetical protein